MNPKNKNQIIALSVMGVILLGVIAKQFLFAGGADTTATTANTSGPAATTPTGLAASAGNDTDINVEELLAGVEVVTYDYERNRIERSPMRPLVGRQQAGPRGILDELPAFVPKKVIGIVWDKYNPIAIIDGEVVGVGHVYDDGVQVYSMERDKVWFKLGDAIFPIEIN